MVLWGSLFSALCLACAVGQAGAQSTRGEIDLTVTGVTGGSQVVSGSLVSEERQYRRLFTLSTPGRLVADRLLYGSYALRLNAPGCQPILQEISIEDVAPKTIQVQLTIAPLKQTVTVSSAPTLLDTSSASPSVALGSSQLQEKLSAQPGRDLLEIIQDQPGWLFEANGVLHPRGSEYDTQFVINGVPRTENLSPSFAASPSAETVQSAQVLTAGFPAEYGRSLGGVVDITTGSARTPGLHGVLESSGGAFATASGSTRLGYGTARQQATLTAEAYRTDRFLDPPVLGNFTNRASAATTNLSEQVDLSPTNKIDLDFSYAALHSMVPNELVQQNNGQQQNRGSQQASGSLLWQHTISPGTLLTTAGNILDTDADLRSNAASVPIDVGQDRGFRQGWFRMDLAGESRHNEWKVGVDAILRHVHEQLSYTITDASAFDPGTLLSLQFADKRWDTEPSGFVQDTLHVGRWNVAAGLRYDKYAFIVKRQAWSPRIAASRYFPRAHFAVHASYDRIFQVPAIENLLLASSPVFDSVSAFVQRLPVQPASAHFYEVGATGQVAERLRLSANFFLRTFRNYADDDTLLNTGVSFPIADASARITGEEVTILVPDWRRLLVQLSYSNQTGSASGPVVGGLLIGDEASDATVAPRRFAISQDQRNSVRARARWSPRSFLWFGLHASYNSGLPVELDGDVDQAQLQAEYGERVLRCVNFDRGRIRPWSSIDLLTGLHLLPKGDRDLSLEVQATNLGDRVNVVNFASLFSGTAIAPPRSVNARLRYSF